MGWRRAGCALQERKSRPIRRLSAPRISLSVAETGLFRSNCGVPGRIRTRAPLLRRQPLCPPELLGLPHSVAPGLDRPHMGILLEIRQGMSRSHAVLARFLVLPLPLGEGWGEGEMLGIYDGRSRKGTPPPQPTPGERGNKRTTLAVLVVRIPTPQRLEFARMPGLWQNKSINAL